MSTTTMQIRIDTKVKRDAAKVFKSMGLDLSTGVKLYLYQVTRTRGVPFLLVTENGYTLEQEAKLLAIVKKTEEDYAAGRLKGYKSVKEMHRALLS